MIPKRGVRNCNKREGWSIGAGQHKGLGPNPLSGGAALEATSQPSPWAAPTVSKGCQSSKTMMPRLKRSTCMRQDERGLEGETKAAHDINISAIESKPDLSDTYG